MITLYDYPLSGSCYKVRLLLSLLSQSYQTEKVDFYPGGEHRRAEFLQLNPLGQLPVLTDGKLVLRDAQAILVYLASKYDSQRQWYPDSPSQMGEVAMWLAFAGGELMNASAARLHDMLGYDLDVEQARKRAHSAFQVLDDYLLERRIINQHWLVGDHPTIADIACFPYIALSGDGGIELDDYTGLRQWIDRIRNLANFVDMPGIPMPAKDTAEGSNHSSAP